MKPKNLLFIMSDQHGPSLMGCSGHPMVKTPNLDRLAARGTRFENAYTNCPICVPARASFATGRYVHDCGYWDNADPYDGAVEGWGHRLIAQGHAVVSIGKLHYRCEDDPTGFSEQVIPLHVVDGVGDLIGLIRDDLPERKAAAKYARDTGRGESSYTNYDRDIADAAVKWLSKDAAEHANKPWVLFVSFVCPHFPLIAPDEFYDLYPEDQVPLPELYDEAGRPTHPYYAGMRACINYDKHFDDAAVRRAVAGYFGLCSFVDHNVGRVVDALVAAGLADETRIIYTSDHGEALGKRGLWGKSTMFEESAAVPLIMAGPDVPAGRTVSTLASLVDGAPTIMQCVGAHPAPQDATLPGRSLFEIIEGAAPQRTAFSEYHAAASMTGTFMVRDGSYKLVYFVGMEPELFDLKTDPDETRNLAALPEYADVLARMTARLREICDPEEVDRRARADQAATIAKHGGREELLKRGDFGYSPAPGQKPEFSA